MQKINVSHAGDPVHAGDKALTWETPVQRGEGLTGMQLYRQCGSRKGVMSKSCL